MRNLKLFLIKLLFNDIYSEQQQIIKYQRIIIESYDEIASGVLDGTIDINSYKIQDLLRKAYEISQDTHTMTGASER